VARRDGVLAIGGSAGGIEALVELAADLPADLPACVLVTIHVGGNARSNLPHILSRAGPLPAAHARHGEPLLPGRIYVAPPDFHLLAGSGVARLSSGPRVNRHRPAVDVMFASAARWAGPRVVAVVLSGVLDDGAVGAALVARAGGRVVVQDPADAVFDSMPRSAWAAVPAATAVPAARLGKVIGELLREQRGNDRDDDGGPDMHETSMGESSDPAFLSADEARLTRLSCPECSGGLAEIDLGGIRYYRCHVGHQYSPRSLEAAQREAAESKLWAAAAALEEHAAMARHLAGQNDGAIRDDEVEGYRLIADRSAEAARSVVSRLRERGAVPGPIDGRGPGSGPFPVRTAE
jgi:two-component system, chemotaxis family, protein-glutamate methylesterase/glutaminase